MTLEGRLSLSNLTICEVARCVELGEGARSERLPGQKQSSNEWLEAAGRQTCAGNGAVVPEKEMD